MPGCCRIEPQERRAIESLRWTSMNSWMQAIEHSFHANPVNCPDCKEEMGHSVVYSGTAFREISKFRQPHDLTGGYFRLKKQHSKWTFFRKFSKKRLTGI